MTASPEAPARKVSAETQALRAVAVLLVVVYHLRPTLLVGGFIGVDVFFVISGYLITRHLVDEAVSTGRISIARFWARRARRLLPAALLVLVVTTAATFVLLPSNAWAATLREVVASALYVQNWALAADAADYFAAGRSPSPVQHYWSLSVEEQFYLVWPLIIVLALVLGRVMRRPRPLGVIAAGLVVVVVGSFAASVIAGVTQPQGAYFFTHVRAWEFGLGGLAALALRSGVREKWSEAARASLAWAGWIGIGVSAVLIPQSASFPGAVALAPVAAALAVIAAGPSSARWSASRWAERAPVTRVGDWSYSIYLWHWPVIVFGAAIVGGPLPVVVAATAVLITIVLAWLTYRFVENPVRHAAALTESRPRRTAWAAVVVTMLVVAVPAGALVWLGGVASDSAARTTEGITAGEPCFGAAAVDALVDCSTTEQQALTPDLAVVEQSLPPYVAEGCRNKAPAVLLDECEHGSADAPFRLLLIGDSHAGQWESAVRSLADARGWSYTIVIRGGCPWSSAPKRIDDIDLAERCEQHSERVDAELAEREPFDLVLTSSAVGNPNAGLGDEIVPGFRAAWAPVLERGTPIVVLRDTPEAGDGRLACLLANSDAVDECAVGVDVALASPDLAVTAAEGLSGVTVVDLNRYFCFGEVCPAVIGGVVVYRDGNHVTDAYVQTLAPVLARELERAGVLPAG